MFSGFNFSIFDIHLHFDKAAQPQMIDGPNAMVSTRAVPYALTRDQAHFQQRLDVNQQTMNMYLPFMTAAFATVVTFALRSGKPELVVPGLIGVAVAAAGTIGLPVGCAILEAKNEGINALTLLGKPIKRSLIAGFLAVAVTTPIADVVSHHLHQSNTNQTCQFVPTRTQNFNLAGCF